jgi:predicted NAD/FAD-binding protein
MKRLTLPAPHRESYFLPHGLWATRRWTLAGVMDVLAAGGWFHKGHHDFASAAVAKRAGVVE